MKSVNKVIIIGNLTRDPEVVQVGQNSDVAKFTIAVNESYKKQDGTNVENTTYIDCEAWSGLAKVVGQYLKKGSKVYIEGALKADTWQDADTGKNRTKHKVRVSDMVMLDGRGGGAGNAGDDDVAGIQEGPSRVEDDELPF